MHLQKSDQCHFNIQCATWFSQIMVSFFVLAFCACMIAFKNGQLEVYLPLMTSTASVWVPTPKAPKKVMPPPPSPEST